MRANLINLLLTIIEKSNLIFDQYIHYYRKFNQFREVYVNNHFKQIVTKFKYKPMQQLEDFKCILCRQHFTPPYCLPYLLPCTHSLCSLCLQNATTHKQTHIICPQDLQSNLLSNIRSNFETRRALQKLVKQHKNYNQNNQLLCIQTLSKHFENALEGQKQQRNQLSQLIDQIFKNEIQRLSTQQQKIKQQLENPFKVVQEWKDGLKGYLFSLKEANRNLLATQIEEELNYYIQQGRKVKLELNHYDNINVQEMAGFLIKSPQTCLQPNFSLKQWMKKQNNFKTELSKATQQTVQTVQQVQLPIKSSKKIIQPLNSVNHNVSYANSHLNQLRSKTEEQERPKIYFSEHSGSCSNHFLKPIQRQDVTNSLQQIENNRLSIETCSFKKEASQLSQRLGEVPTHRQQKKLKQIQLNHNGKMLTSQNSSINQKNFLIYSPDYDLSQHIQSNSHQNEYEQLLLTDKQQKKVWSLGNFNFLQQWKLGHNHSIESLQIKKRQPYNWEKEKNNYIKRMDHLRVDQACRNTSISHNTLQMINYSLHQIEMTPFLQSFDWSKLQVIKLVRTNLTDMHLNDLLNFLVNSHVTTLVLSGNCLTQLSLDALLNFTKLNSSLHNIYISKNNINCLKGHARTKISLLRETGLNLYI